MLLREPGMRNGNFYYHIGDGYHYKAERASHHTVYFTCHRNLCGGRAVFKLGEVFHHTLPHNHGPNILYTEVQAAIRQIVGRARSLTYVSFADIIASERNRIDNRAIRSQLTIRRLRPAMLRARRQIFPNIPRDLFGLTVTLQDPAWEWLTKTTDLQDKMYLGSTWADDGSHNIIFLSSRCLEIMRLTSIIFADGTFYIAPSVDGCYQVFTLVTISDHTVIPLCWCLMEKKTEAAYVAILQLIRQHLRVWSFTRVVSDFEDAIINAFRTVFQIEVQGCYFHSANAMASHARLTIGVQILQYNTDIKNVVRLCCALPLLPQNLIQRGFDIIGQKAMEDINIFLYILILRPYLEYVQYEWLWHANRGPTLSVSGSEHRTNNASESNNRRMKRIIGVHHPNIYHFIRQLTNFEQGAVDDIDSIFVGMPPNRHRSSASISNDALIMAITSQLNMCNNPTDEQILTFLIFATVTVDDIIAEMFQ